MGDVLQEYVDTAKRLEEFVEQLKSYRAKNRSQGIQWQGGGFGLSGAIGGAVMAGALNLATDAVRGIGHAVVDSADRARLRKVQLDLYKARDHKSFLGKRLYTFCMDLFDTAVHLLEENYSSEEMKMFIESGFWRTRRSGRELNFGQDPFEVKADDNPPSVTVFKPILNWEIWAKTVGEFYQAEPDLYIIKYLDKLYQIKIEHAGNNTTFLLQNCGKSKEDVESYCTATTQYRCWYLCYYRGVRSC